MIAVNAKSIECVSTINGYFLKFTVNNKHRMAPDKPNGYVLNNDPLTLWLYTFDDIKQYAKPAGMEPVEAMRADFIKVADCSDKTGVDLFALVEDTELISEDNLLN